MRTNIVLNDELLEEARQVTGIKQKKELVHEALKALIQQRKRKKLSSIRGQVKFSSNYDYKKHRE